MTGPPSALTRTRARTAGATVLVLVVVLLVGGGGYLLTRLVRQPAPAKRTPAPTLAAAAAAATAAAESAPQPAGAAPGIMPSAAALTRTLGPALSSAGIGPQVRARVVDVATGTTLFDRGGAVAAAPASAAKLLTAAAILTVDRPTDRLSTTVLGGTGIASGTVYLRGGGDPTLTAAAPGKLGRYPQAARLRDLAAAVRRAGVPVRRIVVDGSLFNGPTVSPAWAPDDVPSDYASAITGVMIDGGRAAPDDQNRSATPDLAAGAALAAALGKPGLTVSRGRLPASGGRVLGTVESAPIATLVQQMLLESDNVIAEMLARQVAVAQHRPASFVGAAAAVETVVRGLGADPGRGLADGSGLAARDRVSPATLVTVLRAVADGRRPALSTIASALPVAGWSGTLADRYLRGSARAAAGDVRAKTGTLTGVSALAGLVHDRDGRLLVFAFIADQTSSTPAAEAALDSAAATIAACGCR